MRFAYFDTCVTIYYVERNPDYFSRIEAALFSNEEAAVFPVVSDLTRLECRVFSLRTGDRDLLDRYDTFFGLSEVRCVNIDRRVFDLATELRARHGLQLERRRSVLCGRSSGATRLHGGRRVL
ncbi:MAG: PIN domain-containing protein [Gammaproteobacteria bacterium]